MEMPPIKTHRFDNNLLLRMDSLSRRQYEYLEYKYVARTQKHMPDKFLELCHMHLAFLLDLSDDKLEKLILSNKDVDAPGKKRRLLQTSSLTSAAVSVFKKKVEKIPSGLFGAPLTDEGVCLILPLINYLKSGNNMRIEGLFRKSGNRTRILELRESLILHGASTALKPDYTAHDIACVLKEFLRELPEPLLTEQHMEAHRQIQEMGQHAHSEEMKDHFCKKKLSALQLLVILLPSPVRKVTLHVLELLQQVAECKETKMTPVTLGTIFAPIFFLNRKVDASEMCTAISLTEPALAFMIENAHQLYKVPNKLMTDLADYWNDLQTQSPPSQGVSTNVKSSQLKKSYSGQTLNTNICYLDRAASRCDDVASNTQAELDSLFAHVQSLPDTPLNMKLKKSILKPTPTPTSVKKHRQSKPIGSTLKKRLPALSRSKHKGDISTFSISSSSSTCSTGSTGVKVDSYKDCDNVAVVHCAHYDSSQIQNTLRKRLDFFNTQTAGVTPSMSDLLKSPAAKEISFSQACPQPLTLGQKRCHSIDGLDACSPPKQECKTQGSSSPSSVSESSLSPTMYKDSVFGSYPVSGPFCNSIMTPSEDGSSNDAGGSSPSFIPANSAFITSPVSLNKEVSQETADKCRGCGKEMASSAGLNFSDEENRGGKDQIPSKAAYHLPSLAERVQSPLTPNTLLLQRENEITYLNQPARDKIPAAWKHERNVPVQHRSCNTPGTPVMSRTLLRLAQCDVLETSI